MPEGVELGLERRQRSLPLAAGRFREMFRRYRDTRGAPPSPDIEPSEDQLSAIAQVVEAGFTPYADFGLFGKQDACGAGDPSEAVGSQKAIPRTAPAPNVGAACAKRPQRSWIAASR